MWPHRRRPEAQTNTLRRKRGACGGGGGAKELANRQTWRVVLFYLLLNYIVIIISPKGKVWRLTLGWGRGSDIEHRDSAVDCRLLTVLYGFV
ncbi:hypothetical protein BDN71DRAFT_811738 [Pleurotus eryngii]|uniref:Uncharacterized protein n=1 Tax=Pleurotus eryngii TaxID=5323 RepID=A0A9P6A1Y0_PLEER|nr:hypothetical protein BDN71DRAFT_811738 [Pleurotus eryngii]